MAYITEQQVQAKAAQLRDVLYRKRLEGLNMEAVLDLDATARQLLQLEQEWRSDDTPAIKAELHGFCNLCYTIHLSPMAVSMLIKGGSVIGKHLRKAISKFAELEEIFIPLFILIEAETDSIAAVSKSTGGGPVRLEGVLPVPYAVPFPDDPDFWPDEHPRSGTGNGGDSGGGSSGGGDSGWSGDGDGWPGGTRGGPGDIWDPGDV
ncbi:hypothetical protein [Nocardia paucivorans]|uniref:hypothetical protein n=1 Tax=Nocardia paucivorans TaxID=114259 RepID=UPI0002DED490|nr:hypothetical protein [Nocardia paucivorans]